MKNIHKYIPALLLLVLSGCAANNAGRLMEQGIPLDGLERAYKPDRSYYIDGREVDGANREESIKSHVEQLPGVENADVTINGETALISVFLYGDPDEKEIIRIKKSVKEHALDVDRALARAAVSAAPELYERALGNAAPKRPERVSPRQRRLFPAVPTF